jgi:hypothetical protein
MIFNFFLPQRAKMRPPQKVNFDLLHSRDETRPVLKSLGKMLFKNNLCIILALVCAIWPLPNVQCSTVQCSAVQCSAVCSPHVQCSTVQCSAVQCSAVQYAAPMCSAVQRSAVCSPHVQCSAVECSAGAQRVQWPTCHDKEGLPPSSAVQCSAVQCSVVQCSVVQCSAVHRGPGPATIRRIRLQPIVDLSIVPFSLAIAHWMRAGLVQCSAVQCSAVHTG